MILVFDIGNTETTVGVFDGDELRAHWRLTTAVERTPDELGLLLHELLRADSLDRSADHRAPRSAPSCPRSPRRWSRRASRWLGVRARVVDARAGLPIVLQVDEPLTVGADRILNTLAASRIYKVDTVVVDLGTATTYDCITADGVFFGGIIAPGLRTSADTLIRRTSKLPATELVPPPRAIGTRTEDCIRAGVLFGAADAIDGLVRRIKAEWPTKRVPKIVATGGLAPLVTAICREIDLVEPHLTLFGLQIAFEFLEKSAIDVSAAPRHAIDRGRLRALGYRLLPGDGFSYVLHMRPREWPIMVAHTMLGFLVAQGLRCDDSRDARARAGARACSRGWCCSNGGTLAINSAFDRDDGRHRLSRCAAAGAEASRAVGLRADARRAGRRAAASARLRRLPTRSASRCRSCTACRRCDSRRSPARTGSST